MAEFRRQVERLVAIIIVDIGKARILGEHQHDLLKLAGRSCLIDGDRHGVVDQQVRDGSLAVLDCSHDRGKPILVMAAGQGGVGSQHLLHLALVAFLNSREK